MSSPSEWFEKTDTKLKPDHGAYIICPNCGYKFAVEGWSLGCFEAECSKCNWYEYWLS